MTSNNPLNPDPPDRPFAADPPNGDEDPNLTLVEQGLEAAENEVREAVADAYESSAADSPSKEENLNDIDFTEAETPQKQTRHLIPRP